MKIKEKLQDFLQELKKGTENKINTDYVIEKLEDILLPYHKSQERKKYCKKYYENHRNPNAKRYKHKTEEEKKEYFRQQQLKYYEKHKEEVKAKRRERYLKNREKELQKCKERYAKKKEEKLCKKNIQN